MYRIEQEALRITRCISAVNHTVRCSSFASEGLRIRILYFGIQVREEVVVDAAPGARHVCPSDISRTRTKMTFSFLGSGTSYVRSSRFATPKRPKSALYPGGQGLVPGY